jgi:uncharacterized RDD family membrane protein YckC
MAWYYLRDGQSAGPIEAPELQNLVQVQTLSPNTMVWTEGMAQWQPFHTTPLAASLPAVGVAAAGTHACAECGKIFPTGEMLQYENSWVCPTCKPIFFQRIQEGATAKGHYKLATIGRRFVAVLCDGFLILFITMILLFPMYMEIFRNAFQNAGHSGEPPKIPTFSVGFTIYQYFVSYGLPAAYEIFFIGAFGATLGKMLMKIKVVTPEGGPISYWRATGRHFAKLLSAIILYIGYLMAFWDDEKRALHDRMAGTRVISTE